MKKTAPPEQPLSSEAEHHTDFEKRDVTSALLRGARGQCAACGKSSLFKSYLKIVDRCKTCGTDWYHQRADDAPAYFTMLIVGHIVGMGLLLSAQYLDPPVWLQLSIWIPATIILSLLLLPPIKGMLVALQWALKMHGFSRKPDREDTDPLLAVPPEPQ